MPPCLFLTELWGVVVRIKCSREGITHSHTMPSPRLRKDTYRQMSLSPRFFGLSYRVVGTEKVPFGTGIRQYVVMNFPLDPVYKSDSWILSNSC